MPGVAAGLPLGLAHDGVVPPPWKEVVLGVLSLFFLRLCTIHVYSSLLAQCPMPTFIQLLAAGATLAWLLVIVAAIKLYWMRRAHIADAPPPGNSDWYTVMQGALWLAFLFMSTQSVLVWVERGRLSALESVALVCFAIGFAVTCAGFSITVIRWRRAKQATRAST
jgi:hypothetical protein